MDTMDQVNAELDAEGGPFFLGKDLSLVDCVFAPFLERIVASIPYYKGVRVRGEGRFPHLERFFSVHEGSHGLTLVVTGTFNSPNVEATFSVYTQ